MVRTACIASGLLLSLNVAVLACEGAACPAARRVPAADIQHFMREQAANTRSATLPRLTARMPRRHATRMRLATRRQEQVLPATGGVHTALQRRHNTIAAWRVDRSRAGTARSKAFAAPNEAEFTVQETVPNDQVVQAELSFGPADSADQNARQVVAQAFADIDREGAGSLTASDLLAANDRARDGPNRLAWVQGIWAAFKRAVTGVGSGVPER